MKLNAKKAGMVAIAIAALFVLYLYGKVDPEEAVFPKCPFLWATGLKCPGCGSQRALHQLLNLKIGAAFRYNACLVILIPVLLFLFFSPLLRDRFPKLEKATHSPVLAWVLLIFILLWWILRNVFGW